MRRADVQTDVYTIYFREKKRTNKDKGKSKDNIRKRLWSYPGSLLQV